MSKVFFIGMSIIFISGLFNGSFAWPMKHARGWKWENLWLFFTFLALVVLPLALLSQSRVRNNPQFLYWTCAIVVMGFMTNRLNVSITAVDAMTGANYVPKWPEFALTIAVLTAGVCAFRWAIIYLDIVPKREPRPAIKWTAAPAEA